MATYNFAQRSASVSSMLLANFAAAWGFVVAPIYAIGFGLMLPYVANGTQVADSISVLPLELPLIGLCLGILSLAMARRHSWPNLVPCIWGIVLNAVPMALAIALRIRAGTPLGWWSF